MPCRPSPCAGSTARRWCPVGAVPAWPGRRATWRWSSTGPSPATAWSRSIWRRRPRPGLRAAQGGFDPGNRMNPGKVVAPYRIDENLRLGASWTQRDYDTFFSYPDDDGRFDRAVMRCVGVGKCRHSDGGVMCPSYMATREEEHSTRGRSRLLFEMLEGHADSPVTAGWRSTEVRDALDLCLACKGCKKDCPVEVDMATMKAEFLAHHYAGRLRPRAHYSTGWLPAVAQVASRAPRLVNAVTQAPVLRDVLTAMGGIDRRRRIPLFAGQTATARRVLQRTVHALAPYLRRGARVVGLEPSCTAVFRSDARELMPGNRDVQRLRQQTVTLAELLRDHTDGWQPPHLDGKAIAQTHCHQHAIMGYDADQALLRAAGIDLEVLDAGCCGLAGNFGIEAGHYDIRPRRTRACHEPPRRNASRAVTRSATSPEKERSRASGSPPRSTADGWIVLTTSPRHGPTAASSTFPLCSPTRNRGPNTASPATAPSITSSRGRMTPSSASSAYPWSSASPGSDCLLSRRSAGRLTRANGIGSQRVSAR